MNNESMDLLAKIKDWEMDLHIDNVIDVPEMHVDMYKQLQSYFKKLYLHFDDIIRISEQLDVVVQDFIRESNQVEQVAVFLKKDAGQQTLDIEECVGLVKVFTDKINNIYNKSHDIISIAQEMDKNNQSVRESVNQLVSNQAKNDEAIGDILRVINGLSVKTKQIGEITKLINRISSETNLLGLNAKVEAVRAGFAGKGFSVVAEEIQRLSRESSQASGSINDTIASVTEEIGHLEKVAQKSQTIFKAQSDSVNDVNSAFERNSKYINTSMSEQQRFNTAIEEIKKDEDTLVSAISSIFSSVKEVSATANEIYSLTYNQNNSISLLCKLEDDLANDVNTMQRDGQMIKVKKETKPKKKVAIIFDACIPFWDPAIKEAKKAANTYNYDVVFYAPKTGGMQRVKEMAGYLDEIVENKFDGVVISPVDHDLICQKLKQMNKLGIKIIFINSKLDGVDYISLIQTDGIAAGAAAARAVINAIGSQGDVIVNTWGDTHISAIENRKNGFVQELKRNSNIIVHEAPVYGKPSGDQKQAFDAILQETSTARYIFLTNCEWAEAFANYKKRTHANIPVVTVDFTKEIQKAMNEGLIQCAIGQRAYSWGSMALSFLDKNYQHKTVKNYVDTGTFEVNPQNLSIYNSMV